MHDIHTLMDQHDAIGLAGLVDKGEVSPGELLEASIARLEKVEPQLNAVAEKLYDSARQAKLGHGPLRGVPTLIKDLFAPLDGARMSKDRKSVV